MENTIEYIDEIQKLEEEYNTRIFTRDNVDDELNIWAEYMKGKGYDFVQLVNMVLDEEYLNYKDDYDYYVIDTGYIYPHVEYCCNSFKELEEYFKGNN